MNLKISKNLTPSKFTYDVYRDGLLMDEIRCSATTTYGITLRKIQIINSSTANSLELNQENIFIRLLSLLPIINTVTLPNFVLYVNRTKRGYTKTKFFKPDKYIMAEGHCVELHLHKDNYVSVMVDGKQIALIQKEALAVLEKNQYNIIFENNIEIDFIALLTVFIDISFFRKNELRISAVKWEKSIDIGKDKYQSRLAWVPLNEEKR